MRQPGPARGSLAWGLLSARVQVLLNGRLVFSGPLPEDLDVSGALQVGLRENHSGGPGPAEVVWLDGVTVEALGPGLRR